ncbi:NADPH-dependent F420 reductase [Sphingomonas abietis]|uniref:NAD(P)-binding domain-containing protein n=1 Tax=Sphingomonas abietis TaxID=3012344 RepID=A0ABY7NJR7_9SPHN|nr:NAD(P)-binding domain-containing protein [Sphingomonas abietis]WBO20761.1 NAD(P)-binding domain-containing protein [Sphingomonas abietis]
MKYAIIGFGPVGQALARMFARKGIEVVVATTRAPDAIAAQAAAIGTGIIPEPLGDAVQADVILLAVPFPAHPEVAKAAPDWQGKTIIDVTNAYAVPPEDLGQLPSSAVIAKAFVGAQLVKAFNHLPAKILDQDPAVAGGRRVAFLAGDEDGATDAVAALVEQLGYAPVKLGALAEGGMLVQARGTSWAPLIFQDLFKKEG